MIDKTELSLLLDYYGQVLTQRQTELMRMSADEDMSLSEIAEQEGISRQAVRDCLAKAASQLKDMDLKLGLVEHDRKLRAVAEELGMALESGSAEGIKSAVEKALRDIGELIR